MSLADRIPGEDRSLNAAGISFVLLFGGFAFAGFVVLLYTLQRLGMAGGLSNSLVAAWMVASVLLLSWLGRSVTGPRFFSAARKAEAISIGLGSASCWLGGAVIFCFFALPEESRFLLLTALLLGLALQTFLLAPQTNASGTSTIPDLLAKRYRMRTTGLACTLVCLLVLGPLAVAEFDVATRLFADLSGVAAPVSHWTVAALVLLPIMFGGWQALLLVNACIGLWILMSMLTPALVVGFLPVLAQSNSPAAAATLQPILVAPTESLTGTNTPFQSLVALLVLAAGFAALPQTLARNTLARSRMAAIEGLGWTGLVIFLSLSALLLSIGLVVGSGTETKLGTLLRSSATISVLPYTAFFLAAFNALSATLFVIAVTVVRAFRAHARREPGVGSMFAIRLFALLLAALLVTGRDYGTLNTVQLLQIALAGAAAGLFPVLVASAWLPGSSGWFAIAAMVSGTGFACVAVFLGKYEIVPAGALGAVISTAIVLAGHLWTRMQAMPASEPIKRRT